MFKLENFRFEALIRWNNTEFGMLQPDTFLPLAEENGFILDIGAWVLRTVCFQSKAWQNNSIYPFYVSVNISGQEFYSVSFTSIIDQGQGFLFYSPISENIIDDLLGRTSRKGSSLDIKKHLHLLI